MRPTAHVLAMALALAGCKQAPQPDQPVVENAWIRLPAAPGRPAAGYFTLRGGKAGATLTGVSSPQVQRAELHDSMMSGGMMHMAPLGSVAVPAGGTLEFKPGGKHAMLYGVDASARPGAAIELIFTLQPSARIRAQARIVGPADPAPTNG